MKDTYIRVNEVAEMLSIGVSTIWAWVKVSKFPPPIKLSERCSVWSVKEINDWIERKRVTPDWINEGEIK